MQHCTASHLGLCCLPVKVSSHKKDIRLIWNRDISLHSFLSYKFSYVTTEDITLFSQSEIQSKKGVY